MNARPRSSTGARPTKPRSRRQADLRDSLVEALEARWRVYRKQLKRSQKLPTEETVHDLRVATRRLISLLDIVLAIHPDDDLRRARRRLKQQLDLFSPLRDIQVQLLTVEKMCPTFPELQGFAEVLAKRERKLRRRLGTRVRTVKMRPLRSLIRATVAALNPVLATPARRRAKRTAVLEAVEMAFQRVVERRRAIDPNDMATIHRMRVAFKKFRYMVEALAPILKEPTAKQLKAMNAFQDSMGAIQDVEVLLGSLQAFAQKSAETSKETLAAVNRELFRQRDGLVEGFLPTADTLFTFWKSKRKPTA
jgi:CHAD domain-containing protein